jgi:hypothetical protein
MDFFFLSGGLNFKENKLEFRFPALKIIILNI